MTSFRSRKIKIYDDSFKNLISHDAQLLVKSLQQRPPAEPAAPCGPDCQSRRVWGWKSVPSPAYLLYVVDNASYSPPPSSAVWSDSRASGSSGQSRTCHDSGPSHCYLQGESKSWASVQSTHQNITCMLLQLLQTLRKKQKEKNKNSPTPPNGKELTEKCIKQSLANTPPLEVSAIMRLMSCNERTDLYHCLK